VPAHLFAFDLLVPVCGEVIYRGMGCEQDHRGRVRCGFLAGGGRFGMEASQLAVDEMERWRFARSLACEAPYESFEHDRYTS